MAAKVPTLNGSVPAFTPRIGAAVPCTAACPCCTNFTMGLTTSGYTSAWIPLRNRKTELRDCVFRVAVRAAQEVRVLVRLRLGLVADLQVEVNEACMLGSQQYVQAAYGQILEVAIARSLLEMEGRASFQLGVSLWQGGLPLDVLPSEGWLEARLGAENFAWPRT